MPDEVSVTKEDAANAPQDAPPLPHGTEHLLRALHELHPAHALTL